MENDNRGPPLQSTDDDLIASARDGDVNAYGELVRRHQRAAVRVAQVAGATDDAEDVVQEAFVKAYRALRRFRPGAPFGPWLFKIVVNTARNRHRATRRHGALVLRAGTMVGPHQVAPDEAVERRAEREALVAALNRLDARDRLILAYRWFEELTEAEMATALGCRRGTVKSRLNRAMGRLRDTLELDPADGLGSSVTPAAPSDRRCDA